MNEENFFKLYKIERKLKSKKESKEKIEKIWKTLFNILESEKKVIFKNWGVFEKKEVLPRKYIIPKYSQEFYTKSKEVIKFKPGKKLIENINCMKKEYFNE